jgi:hypothetical protein
MAVINATGRNARGLVGRGQRHDPLVFGQLGHHVQHGQAHQR